MLVLAFPKLKLVLASTPMAPLSNSDFFQSFFSQLPGKSVLGTESSSTQSYIETFRWELALKFQETVPSTMLRLWIVVANAL